MDGPKPQPTALKILRGNPGKRALNKHEPKFEVAAPDCPEHLSAEARAEWDRVCTRLVASGVVAHVDAGALAAYCQAYGRWVQAEHAVRRMAENDPVTYGLMVRSAKGNPVPNPLVWVANASMRDMVRCAAEFGMTPSSRSRIKVNDVVAQTENPFIMLK